MPEKRNIALDYLAEFPLAYKLKVNYIPVYPAEI